MSDPTRGTPQNFNAKEGARKIEENVEVLKKMDEFEDSLSEGITEQDRMELTELYIAKLTGLLNTFDSDETAMERSRFYQGWTLDDFQRLLVLVKEFYTQRWETISAPGQNDHSQPKSERDFEITNKLLAELEDVKRGLTRRRTPQEVERLGELIQILGPLHPNDTAIIKRARVLLSRALDQDKIKMFRDSIQIMQDAEMGK